jgi:DNA invertase Pin-like site-specific DNA recombinase
MLLLYARVSTHEQAFADRCSLAEQIKRGRLIAQMRGVKDRYGVAEYVDKGVSGSISLHERPQGAQMLAQAGKGDVIVGAKLDRLFRSATDALNTIDILRRGGVGLIICDIGMEPIDESPAAKMFFGMLSVFAEFERARIHERIIEGKIGKKARGGHIGGNTPFGYRKIGVGRAAVLELDPKEQEHIATARALLAEHGDKVKVSRLMAERGMLGRNGARYPGKAIYRMLHGRSPSVQRVS